MSGYGIAMTLLVLGLDIRWGPYGTDEVQPGGIESAALVALVSSVVLAVIVLGSVMRGRDEKAQREQQTTQARQLAAERLDAAKGERADIARELHDIVSHSVSVIAVQAESATYTTPELSPQAREGFQQIAKSSREALNELRQMLNVLRSESEAAEAIAPPPTLERIEDLLERHRSAGGTAELRTHGSRTRIAASVELSAYRIVQEALTNARRHAAGAHSVVEISYGPDKLTVQVTDDGPGSPSGDGVPDGHGLIGMRERVTMLGGRFFAGPGLGGGFLVRAELPTSPQPTAPPSAEELTP
jgi:signal transduction histidine kinase